MQRLAALERSGATEGAIKGPWEEAFLDLIYRLATQPPTEVRTVLVCNALKVSLPSLLRSPSTDASWVSL